MRETERETELRLVKQSEEGDQAYTLLNNSQFKAAFDFQRNELMDQFQAAKPTDIEHLQELSRRIKSLNQVEKYLTAKIKGGNDAKSSLEKFLNRLKLRG